MRLLRKAAKAKMEAGTRVGVAGLVRRWTAIQAQPATMNCRWINR